MKRRIWEIDILRAVAITLMVGFHIIYDLNEFAGLEINYRTGFWYWEGQLAAMIFMFVSGISSGLTNRNVARVGMKLFGIGMIITAVTYVILGDLYIRFGILHFLGTSMMLYPLLSKLHKDSLIILALVIALLGAFFKTITVSTVLFLPFGVMYPGFRSADYYPLAPYLAVFIMGIIAYKSYYYKGDSLFSFQYHNRFISFLSRRSLVIYLIHQPIIIAVIYICKFLGIL